MSLLPTRGTRCPSTAWRRVRPARFCPHIEHLVQGWRDSCFITHSYSSAAAQVLRQVLSAGELGPHKQRFLLEQLGGQVGHFA